MPEIEKIKNLPCWQQPVVVEPLSGGMTNLNFKVREDEKHFVVRLGDDVPEHLVWRENEGITSQVAADCGFSPRVIYREPGVLVIDFIEGKVFTEKDVRDPSNQERLVSLLHRFHSEMPQRFNGYPVLFWVFQVLRHYRNMLEQGGSPYLKQVPDLMAIAERLEIAVGPVDLVFGHNDLLPANFIDDGERIWLIDFDYAGFNSPLFDLANLASNSEYVEASEKNMLEQYFKHPVDDQLWYRYSAMKCASLLRETMWSMVSEIYSKIDFDYAMYTRGNEQRFERVYGEFTSQFG